METFFYISPQNIILQGYLDDGDLIQLEFAKDTHLISTVCDSAVAQDIVKQLEQYFTGERVVFDISCRFVKGTDFQKKVWRSILQIPYGKTASYKDIAVQVGSPKSSRAIGTTMGKNPLCIVYPCHRVIGSDGSLTGFGGGVEVKKQLLELERGRLKR